MQTNLDTRKIITPAQILGGCLCLNFNEVFGGVFNGYRSLAQKDNQNDDAYCRDEANKDPCPALTCITQASNGNCNTGDQCCQSVEGADDGQNRQDFCNKT